MKICDRCNSKTNIYKMSMFNTQMCCMMCLEIEKKHQLYDKAVKEELNQCRIKNFNFKGIGLPAGFLAFSKAHKVELKDFFDKNMF